MDINKKVTEIISEQGGINVADITPEKKLGEDFGLDSLDSVELALSIEEQFQIEIPEEEWEAVNKPTSTVQEIVDLVKKKMAV